MKIKPNQKFILVAISVAGLSFGILKKSL